MQVIYPVDSKFTWTHYRNAIFLAGPCPRDPSEVDWRDEAVEILNVLKFDGVVFNPTNRHFKEVISDLGGDKEAARRLQVDWETNAMHYASAIVFWIPRSEKFPARTTNYEFGEWYKKPGTFFGWPKDSIHNEYPGLKLEEQGKTHFDDLHSLLSEVVVTLSGSKNQVDLFFTSDTHFGQQRTLELSRRPFVNVHQMDLAMISNWNKIVRMTDIVYHAGDFADPEKPEYIKDLLLSLNYSELRWTLGNYDRKIADTITKIVEEIKGERKIVIRDPATRGGESLDLIKYNNRVYGVVHEPTDFEYPNYADVWLYGHIHGRAFAKRNGFDLATDYHHYTPISLEQVDWFANAMKYWDDNVYTDKVVTRLI